MGGLFTWSTFYEKLGGASYTDGSTTLTGTQYRYINAFPMQVTAHYYTSDDPYETRAYLGGGIGAYKINNRINIGTYAIEDNYWHFGFSPEVGVLIPINMDSKKLIMGARTDGRITGDPRHKQLIDPDGDIYD